MVIALAGKGGTGKTTLAGLVVRDLMRRGKTPVLAVDADPNANLNEVLGLVVEETVGAVRDEMLRKANELSSSSLPKETYLEYRLQESLVESEGCDLLVMGRPEGQGCYCYANTILRKYLDILTESYPYTVIDNEAGMEHLSRTTTQDIDVLLIISDPTPRGLQAALRIHELVDALKLKVGRRYLIINRVSGEIPPAVAAAVEESELPLLATVPADEVISAYDAENKSLLLLESGSSAADAVADLIDKIVSEEVRIAAEL